MQVDHIPLHLYLLKNGDPFFVRMVSYDNHCNIYKIHYIFLELNISLLYLWILKVEMREGALDLLWRTYLNLASHSFTLINPCLLIPHF